MFRIVQIGPYPQSRDCIRGGVEASVFGLAQEQSRDCEVHVFDVPRIGGTNGVVHDAGVIVHRFCNNGKNNVSSSRQVNAIVQEVHALNPDVCHIHGTGLFSWQMYKAVKELKLKAVVTVHGLIRVEKRNMLRKGFTLKRFVQFVYQGFVEKRFLSSLRVAIVDTEYVRRMVNCYPICRKPEMYVIPQGIDEKYFSLHCSADSRMFLSVGAIGERKGHLITLEAFEQLRQNGMNAKLVIVGTIASQAYYDRLRNTIDQSNCKEDVILLSDLSDDELKKLYESAHVFVLHSEEESQGIVFAEAMATGMPVVSTLVGGIPFVVSHDENGLLSEYGNVDRFARNMELLLNDAGLWNRMSEDAISAVDKYHWSCISNAVMKVYKKVVEEKVE